MIKFVSIFTLQLISREHLLTLTEKSIYICNLRETAFLHGLSKELKILLLWNRNIPHLYIHFMLLLKCVLILP